MKQDSHDVIPAKPGNLLKAQRKENGWSIDEIASALRMSASQVRAIEEDDTEQLHGITYIRGYWINYANLMGVNIDDSIEYHKTRLLDPPSMMANPQLHATPSHDEKKKKRTVWVFFTLAVIGSALLYLFQPGGDFSTSHLFASKQSEEAPAQEDSAQNNRSTDSDAAVLQPALSEAQDGDTEIAGGNAEDVAGLDNLGGVNRLFSDVPPEQQGLDEGGSEQQNNSEAGAEQVDDSTRLGQVNDVLPLAEVATNEQPNQSDGQDLEPVASDQSSVDVVASSEQVELENPQELPLNSEPTEAAETQQSEQVDEISPAKYSEAEVASRTDSSAPDKIAFYNSQSGWYDVRDGGGNILMYDDVAANETLILTGRPPFYLYATNAQTLMISYLGKIYPHQAKISENSIRIKISQ